MSESQHVCLENRGFMNILKWVTCFCSNISDYIRLLGNNWWETGIFGLSSSKTKSLWTLFFSVLFFKNWANQLINMYCRHKPLYKKWTEWILEITIVNSLKNTYLSPTQKHCLVNHVVFVFVMSCVFLPVSVTCNRQWKFYLSSNVS